MSCLCHLTDRCSAQTVRGLSVPDDFPNHLQLWSLHGHLNSLDHVVLSLRHNSSCLLHDGNLHELYNRVINDLLHSLLRKL